MEQNNIFKNSVYRYRSCTDCAVDAFKKDRLYFSTPKYFNDPFDAVIHVNENKLLASILRNLDEGMVSYLDAKVGDPTSFVDTANKDLLLKHTQNPDYRVAFLALIQKTIDAVKNNLLTNSKTICFCEEYLSTLMWSHYADYHKGFVLAYEKDTLKQAGCCNEQDETIPATLEFDKIRYQSQMRDYGEFFYEYLPTIYKGNLPPDVYSGFLAEMLFSKTMEWEYEKEWRLCSIPIDFTKPDPAHYISVRPWAVFLGAKMPAKQKWQLYNIAKKKRIAVFEIWTNDLSPEFRLNFQKVDPQILKEEASKQAE